MPVELSVLALFPLFGYIIATVIQVRTRMRIVVTGLGLITSTGANVAECWRSLIEGVDGVRDITSFDTSKYKLKRACEAVHVDTPVPMAGDDKVDSIGKLAYLAAEEAIADSGLFTKEFYQPDRIGLSVGTLGEVALMEEMLRRKNGDTRAAFDDNLINAFSLNLIIGRLADQYGILSSVS